MIVRSRSHVGIGARGARLRGPAQAHDGLLLVGHGSYCRVSESEMHAIADMVSAALPEAAVDVGFLEMTDPPAGSVADRLAARGVRHLTVLPLMLLGAGHAKCDVPAVVVEARLRHPDLDISYGRPLALETDLVTIACDNIAEVGGSGLPLLVNARGTSDPAANADAVAATRLVAEAGQHHVAVTGFSGVTWPTIPDALETCVRLGAEQIAAFAWFLCDGKLVARMRDDYRAFTARTGVEVLNAGYFGPDPRLGPVIVERYHEARDGRVSMACDRCCYRLPFPGLEHRVGQPIGVGHSHLAAEHRHKHAPEESRPVEGSGR